MAGYSNGTKDEARLRVAHISCTYGGVANAAKRLHMGLSKVGVDSHLFLTDSTYKDSQLVNIHPLHNSDRLMHYADGFSKLISSQFGLSGMSNLSSLRWSFHGFDVINLHGADASWFNMNAISRLNKKHALVWTMHDKHLGTGACGYPETWGGCERWREGCGQCPKAQKNSWWVDSTNFVHRRKKQIISTSRMAVVAPNNWMLDFLMSNPITRNQPLKLIPYGVDTDSFSPELPELCRSEFGLPKEDKLILFVSSDVTQPRKGLQYAIPLFHQLKAVNPDTNLSAVIVGSNLSQEWLAELRNIVPVYALGQIDNTKTLARVYSACDLFLILSLIDNFPNVVLESLACGTPVVGFKTGGIPDMVSVGKTGTLAEVGDAVELAHRVSALFEDHAKLDHMRSVCREVAVKDFSLEVQANRYVNLYEGLLADRQSACII